MTEHGLSADDRRFRADFEAGRLAPTAFGHRAHLRLAYTYLAENDAESATSLMRAGLLAFLQRHGIDAGKYHETMTHAWILAVRHFMEISPAARSAAAFIDANPTMLDAEIMLTHYSAGVLFSPTARAQFVAPDLEPIPGHERPGTGRTATDAEEGRSPAP